MSLFLRHDQSAVATEVVILKSIQNYHGFVSGGETLPLLRKQDG